MSDNKLTISRKELESPDAFQEQASRSLDYLKTQGDGLVKMVVGGIIAVVAIGIGYNYYSSSSEAEGVALGRAAAISVLPVASSDVPAPKQMKTGIEPLPHFTDKEQKLKASLEAWSNLEGASANIATAAGLGKASVLFEQGKYKEAAAAYRSFVDQGTEEAGVLALAREGLGYALEAEGDLPGATAAFQSIDQGDPKGFWADVGRFHVARLLEKQGKKDEAIKGYTSILEDFPAGQNASPVREDAKLQLQAMGAPVPEDKPILPVPTIQ